MKYKIVLTAYPFDDLTTIKVRPALCLTEPISDYKHIVMAFISSQIDKSKEESDILIKFSDAGFSETGLNTNSVIKLHRIVTIPVTLIKRELGVLPINRIEDLKEKIRMLFEV